MEGPRLSRLWTSSAPTFAMDKATLSLNGDGNQPYPIGLDTASVTERHEKDDAPPKPPPKDTFYSSSSPYASMSKAQQSQASLAHLASPMPSPLVPDGTPTPRWYNRTGSKSPMASQSSLVSPQSAPVATTSKSKFRLPRLRKRPSNDPGPSGSGGSGSPLSKAEVDENDRPPSNASCPDDSISSPWGFQHNLHVDDRLRGLPTEWANALLTAGYTPDEVNAIYRRQSSSIESNTGPSSSSNNTVTFTSSPLSIAHPSGPFKPRNESLRRLQQSQPKAQPLLPMLPDHSLDTFSEQLSNVGIAKAAPQSVTPVRVPKPKTTLGLHRAPSKVRRVPAPSIPDLQPSPKPPPPITDTTPSKTPEKSRSPPRSPTSPSSIRRNISSTLRRARSSASLRKSTDGPSSSPPGFPPPLPSSPRQEVDRQATMFWNDDSEDGDNKTAETTGTTSTGERPDQLGELPLEQMRKSKSAVSLRTASRGGATSPSLLPPKLELSLPEFDGFGSFGGFGGIVGLIGTGGSPSASPQQETYPSRQEPKEGLGAKTEFESVPLPEAGLGDWGAELLSRVSPAVAEEEKGLGLDTRKTDDAGRASSNVSSSPPKPPLSFNTGTSITQPSGTQLHLPKILPLNVSPKRSRTPETITSQMRPQHTPSSHPSTGPPPSHATPTPPLPAHSLKLENPRNRLSVLIAGEYSADADNVEEVNGLLPYLKGAPSPIRTKFDSNEGQMSRSTSSASMSVSSTTASAISSAESVKVAGYVKPVVKTAVEKIERRFLNMNANQPKVDAKPMTAMATATATTATTTAAAIATATGKPTVVMAKTYLAPVSVVKIPPVSAGSSPRSRPSSTSTATTTSPYDGVLDDWLEGEDDENAPVSASEEKDAQYLVHPNLSTIRAEAEPIVVDGQRPSAPTGFTPSGSPSIVVDGLTEADHSADYNDEIPSLLLSLSEHIRRVADPRLSLIEPVAEGQYGPVFAARDNANRSGKVAVKTIGVVPAHQAKFAALQKELGLLQNVKHQNVLTYRAVYLVGDVDGSLSLWLKMELLDRSLADLLAFLADGLVISESATARCASDILEGLDYLRSFRIAHRDVRSDNILLSRAGVLKLADFSNATLTSALSKRSSVYSQPPYWMAPDMRRGQPYDPHEADVWSVGATVWEIVEGDPPFIDTQDTKNFQDRWPPLSAEKDHSDELQDFLHQCSEPARSRPRASELLHSPFVLNAGPRTNIIELLDAVRLLEQGAK
ncbi:hypothetical protein FRB96_008604 [Tulasnella sp. 330]|nr:hypothetical protein FRB96_008604 [Tulasnella sp. 330]KAG8879332.1 hypothetical protein FRB97_001760 [Tulasnella sp. 331]KAG8879911.1 hypothetical protein FRB98_005464 [Tulasnella sp. 332]